MYAIFFKYTFFLAKFLFFSSNYFCLRQLKRALSYENALCGFYFTNAGINIRMIDQGSSEFSIIVGVEEHDFDCALKAIYNEFVK